MRFEVVLTADAERDLEDIFAYIAKHDSARSAEYVLSRILEIADSLASSPDRGATPKELRELGFHEFRQVYFKPYRVIYRVVAPQVAIYLISDGRRDMQTLLATRLLRS
jgi:toxin ParE1/3/4